MRGHDPPTRSFSEEMSTVPRLDHDELWQASTADLVKMAAVLLGGYLQQLALPSALWWAWQELLSARDSGDCVRWDGSTHVCVMPPSGLDLFTHSPTRKRVGLAAGDTKL